MPPPVAEDFAVETDIFYLYRLILKRDPDPAGLAHYRRLVSEGISFDRLIRSFENCEEHRLRLDDEMTPTPVDLGGYRVCIRKIDTDFGQAILGSRQYEEHVRQAVRENLRAGDVCVDVGANVGVIALLAASIVGDKGRVIAVEPNPDNVQLLYRGIALNGFSNVEVLPLAASNRRAIFSLTGGTSNTHLVGARPVADGAAFAQSVVLDEALVALPRLDMVKMDIEGHEPLAFEGFSQTLARHHPTLLVEFNPRCLIDLHQQDPSAYLKQIFALYPRVRVTSAFEDDATFERAEDVMTYWDRRNREVTEQRLLPDRILHFDLVVPRPTKA
jgi:FkbM family methyltransferase